MEANLEQELKKLSEKFTPEAGLIKVGLFSVYEWTPDKKTRLGSVKEYQWYRKLLEMKKTEEKREKPVQRVKERWEEVLPYNYDFHHHYAGEFGYKRKDSP
jgi:hypothetical protein